MEEFEWSIILLLLVFTIIKWTIENSSFPFLCPMFAGSAVGAGNICATPGVAGDFVFFAAAGEKSEKATPKKIQDARKKGQVPKSQDLNAAVILMVCTIIIAAASSFGFQQAATFLRYCFENLINYPLDEGSLMGLMIFYLSRVMLMCAIVFAAISITGIAVNLAQTGFLFTTDPLKPKFSKLNPIEGFKNIVSKKAAFNFLKTFMKFLLIGVLAYKFVMNNMELILSVTGMSLEYVFPYAADLIVKLLVQIIITLLILGIADLVFQKYDHKKSLKMTKQEVKEEYKQSEGDPLIRSMRRQKQREMSMNRMMSEVADSTVVVTNPTHFAIAIRYDIGKDATPIVTAKGADYVAAKIRERAKENDVPIIENKPLARALYQKVEIGSEINPEFFEAVAKVIAAVMEMKSKKKII